MEKNEFAIYIVAYFIYMVAHNYLSQKICYYLYQLPKIAIQTVIYWIRFEIGFKVAK